MHFYFLTRDKLSQDLLDRFSQSFHQMIGIAVLIVLIYVNLLDPDQFLAKFVK